MAFNGSWLIKVGSYTIPLAVMQLDTYSSSPAQRQDLDAYRDSDGYMHRNTLAHTATKIEFKTVPMPIEDFRALMGHIRDNYTNGLERKVHLTYYEEEYDNYVEGDFYLPATMTFNWYNKKVMNSFRIAFIEY